MREYANTLFYQCVDLLKVYSAKMNMTYEELNVLIFCVIEPVVFIIMSVVMVRLIRKNKQLRKTLTIDGDKSGA